MLFLGVAFLMLVLGNTILRPLLSGPLFVLYWLGCFVCTGLAMLMALLDFRAIRSRARKEQRELFSQTFDESGAGPGLDKKDGI